MKPWDRHDNETGPAWEAFQAYRDAGPGRTLKATTEATGRAPATHRQLELWSSKHDWVARVAAWDRHVDQAVQARLAKDRVERAVKQADLGRALQGVASKGLRKLADQLDKDPKALRGHEVAHLAKVGFEIERVAEGDPNERLALSGPDGGGLEVRIVNVDALPDPREKPKDSKEARKP